MIYYRIRVEKRTKVSQGSNKIRVELWDRPDGTCRLRSSIYAPDALSRILAWLTGHVDDPVSWIAEHLPQLVEAQTKIALEKKS